MISLKKITLCIVCCAILSAVVSGKNSVNTNGGGAGQGSNGKSRNNNSRNTDNSSISTSSSNVSFNAGRWKNPNTSTTNTGSTTHITNNGGSTSSAGSTLSNFGTTGTLADRKTDVMCHICNAVQDKSYDAGLLVSVAEDKRWSCGFLQEAVQDVDPKSLNDDERHNCRMYQIKAEEGGCCAQTMYVGEVGKEIHGSCSLCDDGGTVPSIKEEVWTMTVLGKFTCSSLDFMIKENMFSPNNCKKITEGDAPSDCCSITSTSAELQKSERQVASLRGGVIP